MRDANTPQWLYGMVCLDAAQAVGSTKDVRQFGENPKLRAAASSSIARGHNYQPDHSSATLSGSLLLPIKRHHGRNAVSEEQQSLRFLPHEEGALILCELPSVMPVLAHQTNVSVCDV
jgi:hypothetical protein